MMKKKQISRKESWESEQINPKYPWLILWIKNIQTNRKSVTKLVKIKQTGEVNMKTSEYDTAQ